MDSTVAQTWQVVRFGAPNALGLRSALADACRQRPLLRTVAGRPFSVEDRSRAVIVARTDGELHTKLKLLADYLASPTTADHLEAQGIFVRLEPLASRRVAWIFPGQGSQYPNMLAGIAARSPKAAALLAEADALLRSWGELSWESLAAGAPEDSPRAIWNTQVAMLLGDLATAAALGERGLKPDCVTGHSYGEFAALVVAGAWSLADALRATRVRTAAIARVLDGDSLLISTNAPANIAEQTARAASASGGSLSVSHYNAPNQTVVGGDRISAMRLVEHLQAAGFEARTLAVPVAYHTSLLRGAQPLLAVGLEAVDVRPPRLPMISNVTNRAVTDAAAIRENLVAQLVTPVRYQALVEQLAADGYGVFIEVGAGQVLTQLNRRALSSGDALAISADHPRRSLDEQIARLEGALECAGLGAAAPTARTHVNGSTNGKIGHAAVAARPNQPLRDRAPLEEFLRDFVISQTGFPPEVVELSADFEADLGIDSIERVKMFGELRDLFELTEADLKSLEQVRTIGDVVDRLCNEGAAATVAGNGTQPPFEDATLMIARLRRRADVCAAALAALSPSAIDPTVVRMNGAAEEWLTCESLAQRLGVHPGNVLADRAAHRSSNGHSGAGRPR